MYESKLGVLFVFALYGVPFLAFCFQSFFYYFKLKSKLQKAILQSKKVSSRKVELTIEALQNKSNLLAQHLYREPLLINNISNEEELLFWGNEYLKSLGQLKENNYKDRNEIERYYQYAKIKKAKQRDAEIKSIFTLDPS